MIASQCLSRVKKIRKETKTLVKYDLHKDHFGDVSLGKGNFPYKHAGVTEAWRQWLFQGSVFLLWAFSCEGINYPKWRALLSKSGKF